MIKQRIQLRDTRYAIRNTNKKGAALLVVLFVIMAITILSLGFLSRSDVELACGQNMILRTQMDYLAESGLEHAKGLILNPQDIDSEYWIGATHLQLDEDSSDFYNVNVVRDDSDPTDRCNYTIDCNAYRLKSSEEVGRSSLKAELRLDPCIALWTGADTTLWSGVTINGDVRCGSTLTNNGTINGDVFAGSFTGSKTGQLNPQVLSLTWSSVTISDFTSKPAGGTSTIGEPNLFNIILGPYNPPTVFWRQDDLVLDGKVSIDGMLLVGINDSTSNNLTVRGTNNVIIAGRNLPALYVTKDLIIEEGASLNIEGLAVIDGNVSIEALEDNANLIVLGGLFIRGTLLVSGTNASVKITAEPTKTAIITWDEEGTQQNWGPAAGAFFRSIERK